MANRRQSRRPTPRVTSPPTTTSSAPAPVWAKGCVGLTIVTGFAVLLAILATALRVVF